MRRASVAIDRPAEHAEGPIWDGRDDTLIWVDQYRGIVRRARLSPGGRFDELDSFSIGMPIGAVVPSSDGGWMLAAGPGFLSLARDGGVRPVAEVLPQGPPRRRMNDGKVDPFGRFWAGSMAFDKQPGAGSLYRLDGAGASVMIDGVTISNGLAWTADGRVLYYIDTPTRVIRSFDVTADGLGDGRDVVRLPDGAGEPDGMCIDRDGRLWVAMWGGRAVRCYSPEGRLVEMVEVDAVQVSSCCFGGPNGSTLFITTSQEDYSEQDRVADPCAGMIFSVETSTSAPPAAVFAVLTGT